MTQRTWRTNQTERTRYLMCYCCPKSKAAMKTLAWVDTAREQKDRHFSRAREGEVACERETRQQSARTSQKRKVPNLLMNLIRQRRSCMYVTADEHEE